MVTNNDTTASHIPQPIFIIGAPRSGTSIMTWALGQHPNIQPMPETAWIAEQSVGAFNSWSKGSERGKFSHLSNMHWPLEKFMVRQAECVDGIVNDIYEARCNTFYGNYRNSGKIRDITNASGAKGFHIRRSADDPKKRWVDGTPLNSFYLWGLLKLFPEAKFIHNLRTPRDVIKSLIEFDKAGGIPMGLSQAMQTWKSHTLQADYLHSMLGEEKVFLLDFQRIKNDREVLLNDIFNFLGEPSCANANDVFGQVINSSETDAKKYNDSIQDHKNYNELSQLYQQIMCNQSNISTEKASELLKVQFLSEIEYRNSPKLSDLPFGSGKKIIKLKNFVKRLRSL